MFLVGWAEFKLQMRKSLEVQMECNTHKWGTENGVLVGWLVGFLNSSGLRPTSKKNFEVVHNGYNKFLGGRLRRKTAFFPFSFFL